MNLKEIYKKETGLEVNGNSVGVEVVISANYVDWLEKQLLIHSVVKSSCPAWKVEHTENDCDGYCTAACLQGC